MSGKSLRCASLLFLVVACLCLAPWCAAQAQESSKTQEKLTGETPNKAADKSAAKDGTNQNAATPVVMSADADNSSSADGKTAEMQPAPSSVATGRTLMVGSIGNLGKPTTGSNGRAPQLVDSPGRPGTFSVYMMTEYRRDEISFTGKPSTTLQFPIPIQGPIVPGGPQFVPEAFEPNDQQFIGYTSTTYRDFGFERVRFDVAASFRYTADLDGATTASPFLTLLDTFTGRQVFEPLTAYADIHGAGGWPRACAQRARRPPVYLRRGHVVDSRWRNRILQFVKV